MPQPPVLNEGDHLVTKMGHLTLATGYLEVAIIGIVCRILGKSEDELKNEQKNTYPATASGAKS